MNENERHPLADCISDILRGETTAMNENEKQIREEVVREGIRPEDIDMVMVMPYPCEDFQRSVVAQAPKVPDGHTMITIERHAEMADIITHVRDTTDSADMRKRCVALIGE